MKAVATAASITLCARARVMRPLQLGFGAVVCGIALTAAIGGWRIVLWVLPVSVGLTWAVVAGLSASVTFAAEGVRIVGGLRVLDVPWDQVAFVRISAEAPQVAVGATRWGWIQVGFAEAWPFGASRSAVAAADAARTHVSGLDAASGATLAWQHSGAAPTLRREEVAPWRIRRPSTGEWWAMVAPPVVVAAAAMALTRGM